MISSNKLDDTLSKQTTFISKWYKNDSTKFDDLKAKGYLVVYTNGSKKNANFILKNIDSSCNTYIEPLDNEKAFKKIENIIEKEKNNIEIIIVDASEYGMKQIDEIYYKTYQFIELLKQLSKFSGITIKVVAKGVVQFDEYNPNIHPENALILGIAQTAAKEFTNIAIIPISISQINQDNIKSLLTESNDNNPLYQPILYFKGSRYIRKLVPYKIRSTSSGSFKKNGSYLILGGLGGIGFELSKYLAKNYKAKLILVGRSDAESAKLEEIKSLGSNVSYEKIDLLDQKEIGNLLQKFIFDGIIHSAVALEDKTIQLMSKDTLYKVLDPKVKGAINLYNAVVKNNLNPDFILFFSSIQSFIANSGQANYTAACVFKDTLANLLRNYEIQNTKIINWGYWGSVGIVSSEEYRNRMKNLGIGSIEPQEAFEIIEHLIVGNTNQLTVIKGTKKALEDLHINLEENSMKTENSNDQKVTSSIYNSTRNHSVNIGSKLHNIVPTFVANKDTIQSHQLGQQKLEQYARFSIQQIDISEKSILSRYDRLINAIKAMPKVGNITKEEILYDHPWLAGHIKLLDECISKYPDILTGKVDYMSILFPNGKFDLVEPVYRDNPISDYYNIKVSEIVENYIQNQDDDNKLIKVIEIGAGTGSTTKFVLPKLRKNDNYYYTDLSIAFLKKAKNEFNMYNNVSYDICNIEDTPKDHLSHNFDILIATNVLHATKDINKTISNVRKYLKSGGIAIINEVTERSDYATLTFGLTTGWWLYSDLRIVDSPLVDPKTWKSILNNNNFSVVKSHGDSGQQVIVGFAGKSDFTTKHIEEKSKQEVPVSRELQENFIAQKIDNNSKNIDVKSVIEKFICKNISQIMKIPSNSLDANTPFANYGIDSLIVLELAKPFKEIYKELPSTIFFEYSTINKLRDYLLSKYPEQSKITFLNNNGELNKESKNKDYKTNNDDFSSWLKKTICHTIRINPDELDENSPFANYGIDSLITLEIVKAISAKLDYVPNTIFFEYTTFIALLNYFKKEYKEKIAENFSDADNTKTKIIEKIQSDVQQNTNSNDIAVIGISGIFPKAQNIQQFWNNISDGLNCSVEIPIERWNNRILYDPDGELGKIYTKYGCFIDGVEFFDHKFFQITPFDAENIDPQERLFMQTTYHAIENSGYKISDLKGSNVGVFVGIMNAGYSWLGVDTEKMNWADSLYWSVANRVSYSFDWHGPSMAIDTACSSSLTAIHLACQSIRSGESTIAIAGGVNLILHPKQYSKLCRLRMLSNGPNCKSFGKDADGFVDGEGIAAIMLKPVRKAIEDNDRIYGVIKASSINAGGNSNGYTAPNPLAQSSLIASTLQKSGINPNQISYVEAHGTGTELGDPIEIRALNLAFNTKAKKQCAIGSVKSNIGHLESAAGIAGSIKLLSQLYNKKIVPTLNSEIPNPHINFDDSPFYLPHKQLDWVNSSGEKRIAMISSFGAGGANANAIIEEFNSQNIYDNLKDNIFIIPISGNTVGALQRNIDNLRVWLKNNNRNENVTLYSTAYTLSVCREHYKYRRFFIVKDKDELIKKLSKNIFEHTKYPTEDNKQIIDFESINMKFKDSIEIEKIYKSIGSMYLSSEKIDWAKIYNQRIVSDIPEYAFDDYVHWLEDSKYGLSDKEKYYHHHIINGTKILPAAYTISYILQESKKTNLSDICWERALEKNIDNYEFENDGDNFLISDKKGNNYTSGKISKGNGIETNLDLEKILNQLQDCEIIERDQIYSKFNDYGYQYGPKYKKLQWIKYNSKYALGAIYCNPTGGFTIDPGIIDSGLQIPILPLVNELQSSQEKMFVPFYLSKCIIHNSEFENLIFCCWELKEDFTDKNIIKYNLYFFNQYKNLLLTMYNMTSKLLSSDSPSQSIDSKLKQEYDNLKVYDFN